MQVENFQKLMDTVAQIDEQGRKAVKATVRDVKARAPSWIAQEVTSVYNIKKGEITPSGKNSSKPKKMASSVSVSGETIEELTITYSGRLLTPVHFGMTPKTAPPGKSYTLRMQVVKGQKKVIGRYARAFHTSTRDLGERRLTDFLTEYGEAVEEAKRLQASRPARAASFKKPHVRRR